jgi:peroxiredoxin
LQTRLDDFEKQDAVVMAISVDPPEKSREIVEAYDLAFPILSDPGADTIRAYGVVHRDGDPINGTDIARPATFILDREGRVVWSYLPKNWRIRPRPETLLDELSKIP